MRSLFSRGYSHSVHPDKPSKGGCHEEGFAGVYVVRCFGFALHQAHLSHLGLDFGCRNPPVTAIKLLLIDPVNVQNTLVSFEISAATSVITFQYVAPHSGHSFVDVTKFHLQFQSLDFALPSPLDFNHKCRSLIQHVAAAKRRFVWM